MAQRALVCGASQGIGLATAHKLAESGLRVTLVSRSKDKLESLCKNLPGQGHDVMACDMGLPETYLPEIIQRQNSGSPYTVLVLNSGGPKGGPISQAHGEDFLNAMNQHLVANSQITSACLDAMKQARYGRIITVTSTSVKMPIPHLGVSNTVRAAVASWGKTLSFELAPFQITVNNVMPGYTDTPRLQQLMDAKAKSLGVDIDDVRQEWLKSVPMQRFARPEETAELIDFLVSEKASYITGQSIAVDGGRLGCL